LTTEGLEGRKRTEKNGMTNDGSEIEKPPLQNAVVNGPMGACMPQQLKAGRKSKGRLLQGQKAKRDKKVANEW